MIRLSSIALIFIVSTGLAHAAFDVNDCIINGMKGVSSDRAAAQIRYACDQKNKSYKQQLRDELAMEFGEILSIENLDMEKHTNAEDTGFNSTRFTNKSPDKTVTYVLLELVPAPGGLGTSCDSTQRRTHSYKVTVKPGAAIKLVYPNPTPFYCLSVMAVMGRPPSWKDISFSASAKPSAKDPFAGLD